jgi:hypothetical protein
MNFSKPLTDLSTENLHDQLLEAEKALELVQNSPDENVSVTCGYFFRREKKASEVICLIEHAFTKEFISNELTIICQNIELELKKR